MNRITALLCIAALLAPLAPYLQAQQGWNREGALRKFTGEAIASSWSGCQPPPGNPVVETAGGLMEVDLQDGSTTMKPKPEGNWIFVPRQPQLMAQITRGTGDNVTTSIALYDLWAGTGVGQVTANVNTEGLVFDQNDSWFAANGSEGCAVFAPTEATPEGQEEYVVIFFEGGSPTFIMRVKPKVDVDIYIRPGTELGTLCYLRGNGISFPPETEELFTNASYLVYQSDGTRTQLPLPVRGPGSGKGRSIIWHSNKWDRMLFTDENASGAMLIKASNGIVIDSITSVSIDPGDVKILSASGNINDRWMTTHATVGSKSALILWAMPETVETEVVEFGAGDAAIKQMPLAPWSIVVPFVSSNGSSHTLYTWDPQDVVSVSEGGERRAESADVRPNPVADMATICAPFVNGSVRVEIVDVAGMSRQSVLLHADNGSITLNVAGLTSGQYQLRLIDAQHNIYHCPLQVLR